jgi:hypothetical protein
MGRMPMPLKRLAASLRTFGTNIPLGVILCNHRLAAIDGREEVGTIEIVTGK